MIDTDLRAALERAAAAPTLLVASDYDGTLAELVDDPACAFPLPAAIDALRRLAQLAHTEVAIVSGRSLLDLIALTGLTDEVSLVGSHGSEFEPGVITGVEGDDLAVLAHVTSLVRALADAVPRARVETKPASVAFHTREVDPMLVPDLVASVLTGPGSVPGVSVKHGKDVVELTITDAHKGTALRRLRHDLGVGMVVFVGDDLTDEDAFTALGVDDLSVKVGVGPTTANHRIDDVAEAAVLFTQLLHLRATGTTDTTT